MKNFGKNIFIWIIAFFVLLALSDAFMSAGQKAEYPPIAYSDVVEKAKTGQLKEVTLQGTELRGYKVFGKTINGKGFSTDAVASAPLIQVLQDNKVKFNTVRDDASGNIWSLIINFLPVVIIVGAWIYMSRQMGGSGKSGGGGGGPFSFGKVRSKMLNENTKKVTFKDVAGIEEAKAELTEIVDFLKDPSKFQKLGARIPKGALLVGSPGTGKTLLARAIAGEAGVPFFSISGSDFVEMFVGVGASRVRDMFEQGKRNAPCIIFIDEIDAVGRKRSSGAGGSHEEREQTLNQMLVEMDGFDANEGVIIIAATNRADVLDPALLRPGRFDRQITVPLPDVGGREEILKVHLAKLPQAPDVDAKIIARGTPGFSGAELANVANEAALIAARRNKKMITMRELEEAKDKVMMGIERRSMVMSDAEKRLTAFHEAGHAIVGIHCPASDPIHKATIIPRGRALGMVMRLPEDDRYSYTREKMEADLAVAMGGRVAEEMIFGNHKVTSGASSDIKMATNIAENMVMRWGLSDKLGPINYSDDDEEYFTKQKVSSETRKIIDQEVKRIVEGGHKHALQILTDFRHELDLLGEALLEYETLSGDEITELLAGKRPNKPTVSDAAPKSTRKSAIPSGGINKQPKKVNQNV